MRLQSDLFLGKKARLYFPLRLSTAGVGYLLSVIGMATGAAFGRVIAFFDFVRPTSGTIDLFAVRSASKTCSLAFSVVKLQIYCLCFLLACLYFGPSFTVILLGLYLSYLWWATYAAVGVIRNGSLPIIPFRALISLKVHRNSLKTVARHRDFAHLLATSTFGALSYSAFYLYLPSNSQLLGLRAIDGTLFALSYFSLQIIRGVHLGTKDWLFIALIIFFGLIATFYISDVYIAAFCFFRVGSMLVSARVMASKLDKHVSVSQTLLAISYWFHHLLATQPDHILFVLFCEFLVIIYLSFLKKIK